MSEAGPNFYAWCDERQRIDAFATALSLLAMPNHSLHVVMDSDAECKTRSITEATATIRTHLVGQTNANVLSQAWLNASERSLYFGTICCSEESERRDPTGPIAFWPSDSSDFFLFHGNLALGNGPRSIEAEAAVSWYAIEDDLEDLLVRLCAPDSSKRVPTGACTNGWGWEAPVRMCATYNAEANDIARDLALSWVSLHDKASVSWVAGMPLDKLQARVDAAPRGARVEVKGAGQFSLSRETVLKTLSLPGETLLSALEAAAVPDAAWRAVEPRAREIMEATSQIKEDYDGPQVWQVDFTTRKHVRFLEEHAPFRVCRLPSGGVVLATHPYRSLWPLWADALFVLGLM
jgi:hypothetical protein